MTGGAASSTVLLTGGEGDLARALAVQFGREGWRVLAPGREALDVAAEESVAAYFARLDRLDLLVANAGVVANQALPALSSEEWDRVLAVNARGVFLSLRAALPLLGAGGGQAILIGSRVGRRGAAGQSAYAASKAALIALAQTVAREHGAEGVRCNVVLPGFLETKMTVDVSPSRRRAILEDHLLGRFNTVEEAARGVAFVASLKHVSGQVFQFDSRIDRAL